MQQHQRCGGCRPQGAQEHLLVRCCLQQLDAVGITAPVPAGLALCIAQRHAVQVDKAGAVCGVESQVGPAALRQAEAQQLVFLPDGASRDQFVGFGVFALGAQVQLGREQGPRPTSRFDSREGNVASLLRTGSDNELVGQRVWNGQQVTGEGRRQAVEGHLELRGR